MPKTILITGSSRGIGGATARLAHKRGYQVIVHGKTDSDELNNIHNELSGSIKTFFDVRDKKEVESAINKVLQQVGNIEILVNNAGIARNFVKNINEVSDENAIEEWEVNVLGIIHCVQAVVPNMLEQGHGSIVNIASIKGYPEMATMSTFTYSATKSAVMSITKSLAKEYSPKGVRVNAVAPGYTETEVVKSWDPKARERVDNGILLNRLASPTEIAKSVMFLASDDASYITGTVLLADGGYMLKGK